MVKNNRAKWYAISVIITLLVIYATIVTGWTKFTQQPKALETLKTEGCRPAQDIIPRVIKLEECMRHIETSQSRIEDNMKDGFAEVKELIKNNRIDKQAK